MSFPLHSRFLIRWLVSFNEMKHCLTGRGWSPFPSWDPHSAQYLSSNSCSAGAGALRHKEWSLPIDELRSWSRQSSTQWTVRRTGTFVWKTSLRDFAPPPPSASQCTERSSYLLVLWWPASFSTRFHIYLCISAFHTSFQRWQSSTVLCQLLVCTTALLEPELSIRAVCGAHNSFQTVPVGISNSQGESDY